jgi:hypothetical protein
MEILLGKQLFYSFAFFPCYITECFIIMALTIFCLVDSEEICESYEDNNKSQ